MCNQTQQKQDLIELGKIPPAGWLYYPALFAHDSLSFFSTPKAMHIIASFWIMLRKCQISQYAYYFCSCVDRCITDRIISLLIQGFYKTSLHIHFSKGLACTSCKHLDPISTSRCCGMMDLWAGVDRNGPVHAGTRRPAPAEKPGLMPVTHTQP